MLSAGEGKAEIAVPWRADAGQYAGFLHAGLIGALIDTACGFAAVTLVGRVLASHHAVNCLRPAVGERFIARARVVHVYLTYPFVLSWSLLEAMSVGCLIVGSNTAPVREVIEHGRNGLLTDFFDVESLARCTADALARRSEFANLRLAARESVRRRYDLNRVCLPKHLALFQGTADKSLRSLPETVPLLKASELRVH